MWNPHRRVSFADFHRARKCHIKLKIQITNELLTIIGSPVRIITSDGNQSLSCTASEKIPLTILFYPSHKATVTDPLPY